LPNKVINKAKVFSSENIIEKIHIIFGLGGEIVRLFVENNGWFMGEGILGKAEQHRRVGQNHKLPHKPIIKIF
jgi:hypothetical protein